MSHDVEPCTETTKFKCKHCGEVAVYGYFSISCPGPKPAGNTGRHEDSILWDRLRADLEKLGAQYGDIYTVEYAGEGMFQTLVTAGEPVSHPTTRKGYTIASESDRNLYYDGIILAARKKREKQYGSLIYDPMSDNGHEWSWNTDACAHCGLTSTEIVENGDEHGDVRCDGGKARNGRLTLSAAMSRPLDFEPRVGHKGVEIDE